MKRKSFLGYLNKSVSSTLGFMNKHDRFFGSAISSGLHLLVLGCLTGTLGYFLLGEIPRKNPEHIQAQINYKPPEVETALEYYEYPRIEIKEEVLPFPESAPVTIALESIIEVMEIAEKEKRKLEQKVANMKIEEKSEDELMNGLEKYTKKVEQYPKEHIEEVNQKIRSKKGIKERSYNPVNKVEVLISDNLAVPYYRLVEKKGKIYFQQLAVDEFGDYIVVKEILKSEMSSEDKKNLRIYQITEPIKGIRNTALSIITKMLDDREKF